jgi:hypothetical protein
MSMPEDVASVLVAAGIGLQTAAPANLFISSRAKIPTGDGPFVSLIEYTGQSPLLTHNTLSEPSYQRPGLQLLSRAKSEVAARSMLMAAYRVVFGIRNVTINNIWYLQFVPVGDVVDLDADDVGRIRLAVSFYGTKKFS